MRILIIKLGAVGDVIRSTSILRGLCEKYSPQALEWLTSQSAEQILFKNPFITRIHVWDGRHELGDYDLVINLEDGYEACELASSLQPKEIRGAFVKDGNLAYTPSAWFDMSAISKYGLEKANQLKKENRKTFQQHMAELLGINIGEYAFSLTPEEIEYGECFVSDLGVDKKDKVVGINTGAGGRWKFKALEVEKTIDLIKRLRKELGVVSLILGGEDEKERNQAISRETDMPDGGQHSLRHFAALISQCRAVVTSDSLAMHFAIALRRRIIAFFGPTSPAEIELYGLGTKVYPKMDCLVCYKKDCEKHPNCMDLLSVDDLFQAAKNELGKA